MSETDPLGLVGSTIDDLRFDECVDNKGKGLVYRGKLAGREDPVAIKCLSLSRLGGADASLRASVASRFNEETKILKRLADGTHDIVHCLASGQLSAPNTGETVQYQVLEWLNGRTLAVDLGERNERGMPGRSLRETLDMIESAALALGHAHSQGIVHRDVQPANLMLVRAGSGLRLKVLDFGLAKILGKDAPLGTELVTEVSDYVAPEQRGAPAGEIGPWTDVYSLALVMLEVLRGAPIPNTAAGAIRASSFGVLVPPPVEAFFLRATAADPHARPVDANAFWKEIRELHTSTAKPTANADALAATALDADAAAAIQRIRAMTAGGPPQSDKGTMLMAGAPMQPAVPIQEGPLAGTKPIAIPSPLASSIGHGVKTPLGPKGRTAAMPATPTNQTPQPQPGVLMQAPVIPQAPVNLVQAGQQKSPAMAIGILVGIIILVGLVALALFLRGR